MVLEDSYFVNYNHNSINSAFTGRFESDFQIATTNSNKRSRFLNSPNKLWLNEGASLDSPRQLTFRDDGSVGGYVGHIFGSRWKFYTTNECVIQNQLQICPHRYSQVWILSDITSQNVYLTRANRNLGWETSGRHQDYTNSYSGLPANPGRRYQPALSIGAAYLLRFERSFPNSLVLQLNNAERSDTVIIHICLPETKNLGQLAISKGEMKDLNLIN